jgi:CPA2 family monovalent cation:H+ antiporter-2
VTSAVKLLGFLVGIIVAGFLVVPRLIRFVVRLESPETLLVVSVGLCFGLVLVAEQLGYSVALGAFLAGSLIAESGHAEPIERLVAPLRDVFGAVFFVSVGMLFDPGAVAEHWAAILVLTVVVIVGKSASVASGALLVGIDLRTSVRAGLSLGQIGEFSFLIAAAGVANNAVGNFLYPVAIAVSVLTTFTTPWLIGVSDRVAASVDRRLPHRVQTFLGLYGSWLGGLRGRRRDRDEAPVRRAAQMILIDVAAIATIVIAASSFAEQIAAELALRRELGRALVVIAAILLSLPFFIGLFRSTRALARTLAAKAFPAPEGRSDTAAAPRKALHLALRLASVLLIGALLLALTQPFVPAPYGALVVFVALAVVGVAFWRSARELEEHVRAGAQQVLDTLKRQSAPAPEPLSSRDELLAAFGRVTPLRLAEGDPAVGKTLTELALRSATGVTVVAIGGRPEGIVAPTGRERLRAGDILALVGPEETIRAAVGMLAGKPADDPGR